MIENIRACVFDAYGTLFDVHSAVAAHRALLGERADAVSATWRTKQLEYTWLRSLMQRHADFWQVTGEALDYSLDYHGIAADEDLRAALMQAYLTLQAYPEVEAVLSSLRNMQLDLAILSNGSPAMLDAAVRNAGLADFFRAAMSVERVGIYKPDPKVYALAIDNLNIEASQILFMSSNAWDVAGAASFGFQVVWVNRFAQPRERLPGKPVAVIADLGGLPELLAG